MVNKFLKNIAAGVESIYGFACDTLEAIIEPIADDEVDMPEESILIQLFIFLRVFSITSARMLADTHLKLVVFLEQLMMRLVWTSATSIVIPRILRVRSITMSPP